MASSQQSQHYTAEEVVDMLDEFDTLSDIEVEVRITEVYTFEICMPVICILW